MLSVWVAHSFFLCTPDLFCTDRSALFRKRDRNVAAVFPCAVAQGRFASDHGAVTSNTQA
jgi:hypothetical protein